MSNYSASLSFFLFAKSKDEVKSKLPNYAHGISIHSEEEYGDEFQFKGYIDITAESESELLEKLKTHRKNKLFGPLPYRNLFTITLNGRVYKECDDLPEKLAFLK